MISSPGIGLFNPKKAFLNRGSLPGEKERE